MARSGNKSELIRKYFETNPQSSVKDCISDLANGGVEVSYALVFGVRGRSFKELKEVPVVESEPSLSEMKLVRDFVEKSNLDSDLAVRILKEFSHLVRGIGTIDRFDRVLDGFGKCSKIFFSPSEVVPGVEPTVPSVEEPAVSTGGSYHDVNDDEDDS
jgi:hypothetical protein